MSLGTVVWLEAASRLEPRPRFIYATSSSVYGDRAEGPFRETDSVDLPVSPYAATKKACELLAHTFHHLHGLPVTGLRFFTAFGPRNRPDLAIAKFTRLIDQDQPVPMFGDGTTRRDYTYVDDIVDGIVRAIERCTGHHLYNLGHSEPIALREMIETIARALGKPAKIQTLPEQPGDVRQTYAAIDRARRELGYEPTTPFDEGIRRYVAWYRSHGAHRIDSQAEPRSGTRSCTKAEPRRYDQKLGRPARFWISLLAKETQPSPRTARSTDFRPFPSAT